jgi:hypothetical protein
MIMATDVDSAIERMSRSAIQVVVDQRSGQALVAVGTVLPESLKLRYLSRSTHGARPKVRFRDAEAGTFDAIADPTTGGENLEFRYVEPSVFDSYKPRLEEALRVAYAKRVEISSGNGFRPEEIEENDPYPIVVTYLAHCATHVADIFFGSWFGTPATFASSSNSGACNGVDWMNVGFTSNHPPLFTSNISCGDPESGCGYNYAEARITNSYPNPRAIVSCWTDYGTDGGSWETDFGVDYTIYD